VFVFAIDKVAVAHCESIDAEHRGGGELFFTQSIAAGSPSAAAQFEAR
jgi:hypothetical protein